MRYRRRSARGSSGTLLVTFVLGFGLGFSLCYAMFEVLGGRKAAAPPMHVEEIAQHAASEPGPAAPDANTGALPPAPDADIPLEEAAIVPDSAPPAWPARHLVVRVPGPALRPETRALWRDYAPGGFLLQGDGLGDAEAVRALTGALRSTASEFDEPRGVLIVVAHEGGELNPLALGHAPGPREIAAAGPPADARALAAEWGAEIRARGVGVVLGPNLNVHLPGRGEPGNEGRTFAQDAAEVAAYGIAVLDGLRDGGVHPVITGYPGVTRAEQRGGALVIPEDDLDEIALFMAPFLEALKHGAPGILVSHVAVPAIEGGHEMVAAPFSYRLVHMLLRERVGFDGLILADALPDDAAPAEALARAVVAALAAGCDAMTLRDPTEDVLRAVCRAVDTAVADGTLDRALLDASAERLARAADKPEAAAPAKESDTPTIEVTEAESAVESGDTADVELVEHTVAPGDSLSRIAGQYGVTLQDLRDWNGLTGDDVIRLGEKLVVRVPRAAEPSATPETSAPAPEPAASAPEPVMSPQEPAAPPAAPSGVAGEQAVVFGQGDTLQAIAERYGVTTEQIRLWNELGPGEPSQGEVLHLFVAEEPPEAAPPPAADPAEYDTYVVQPGDTLHRIAAGHGTTLQTLMRINNIERADLVQAGRRLKVPKRADAE